MKPWRLASAATAALVLQSGMALASEDQGRPEPDPDAAKGSEAAQAPSLSRAFGLPGVNPRIDLTGFVLTQVDGEGEGDSRFAARADLFVDLSSKGLGLGGNTLLRTHTEVRANDQGAARFGGALWPQNTGAILPLTGEGIELTSIYLVQPLGRATTLLAGKINAVDLLAADPFFGGWGTKRFQNLAFVAPPSGVVPPTIMGAIGVHKAGDITVTAMVFDPEDRTGDYWVNGLFASGVNGSLGLSWSGEMGGRSTSIGVTAAGSTSRGLDLEDVLAPPGLQAGSRKGSYNVALQFGHDLSGSVRSPSHLSVYAKAAIADGNPNLIQSSFVGGIAGHGAFAGRSSDRFGLGLYYYDFSDTLQDVTAPLVDFDNEFGVEAWYSLALSANADVTLSAQWIDPASGANRDAVLIGGRLGFHF